MRKKKYKYVDVSVSSELLRDLKQQQNEAPGMARYGRFKAWLHYANLDNRQKNKYHYAYVNYCGEAWHCTCGLVVDLDAAPEVGGFANFNLDGVQRAKGHRELPDFGDVVVAFIFECTWMEEVQRYYFDALCQVCGDSVTQRPGKDADLFASIHNISCASG